MPAQHMSRRQRHRRRLIESGLLLALVVAVGVAVALPNNSSPSRPTTRVATRRSGTVASRATLNTDVPTTGPEPSTTTSSSSTTSTTIPNEVTGVFATAAIAVYLQNQDDDINAAVYDLDTGQLSVFRPGALEYSASIAKVNILATLLYQAAQQHTALSDRQQDLASTMIEQSNDTSASDLWGDIGQQTGLAAFDSLVPMPDTVPGTDGHWGGTTTTGSDQINLLRELVQPSRLLAPSAQSYELGLMENVESDQAWGVTAGVPSGVTVALKNGWLPLEGDVDWQVNSIGWVDGDGRDYLIAVLTKNNDTEGDGITTIQGLAPLVWNALAPA